MLATTTPPADSTAVFQGAYEALRTIIDSKPDTDRLIAELVRISANALNAGGAGVWITDSPERPELILEHHLPALQILVEGVPNRGVVAGVRRCARENKPLILPPHSSDDAAPASSTGIEPPSNPSFLALLFVPLKLQSKVALVLVVAVPPPPQHDTAALRNALNFLLRQVAAVESTLADRQLSLIEKDRGRSNKLTRFAEQVHKHLFLGQVAADISNLTRDVLEADRVTVELYPKLKKRIIAVSNVDEPNKRAAIMQVHRLIFDYVRDRHVPVILDREAAKQIVSDPALQDAATAYFALGDKTNNAAGGAGGGGFEAFLATPIKADDPASPVLGVIFVEFASTERALGGGSGGEGTTSQLLAETARLSTTAVANAIDVESVPFIKPYFSIRSLWRTPASTKRTLILSACALALIAIFFLCFVPFDFAIKADCQIRPSAELTIVAPVEARINRIPVRAGEHVYPRAMQAQLGDLVKPLAIFDSTELLTRQEEAIGRFSQLQVERSRAQQEGDMTKIRSVDTQIEQVKAQIDLLKNQIEACTVWSPIEGTVLTENVEQKQYSTPRQGEPLMEVASFTDWELVIDVPESEVAAVRTAMDASARRAAIDGRDDKGVEVEYILYPWPDTRYSIVSRASDDIKGGSAMLLPASQQNKNANVFRLQVKLDPGSLPPGIAMSGVTGRAKVHVGQKPLASQWTRGAWRLLKMTWFF